MAKIQDITELLINEIESFNKSVFDLKKQTLIIQNTEITPNIKELDNLLSNYLSKIKNTQSIFLKELNSLKKPINNTITKFQLIVVLVLFTISLSSLFYSNYITQQVEKKEDKAYLKGVEDVKQHFYNFLEANPKARKSYNSWNKK